MRGRNDSTRPGRATRAAQVVRARAFGLPLGPTPVRRSERPDGVVRGRKVDGSHNGSGVTAIRIGPFGYVRAWRYSRRSGRPSPPEPGAVSAVDAAVGSETVRTARETAQAAQYPSRGPRACPLRHGGRRSRAGRLFGIFAQSGEAQDLRPRAHVKFRTTSPLSRSWRWSWPLPPHSHFIPPSSCSYLGPGVRLEALSISGWVREGISTPEGVMCAAPSGPDVGLRVVLAPLGGAIFRAAT